MSAFTLNFSTDNSAFSEDDGARGELQKMLVQVKDKIADGHSWGHVVDTNGAVVGSFESTFDGEDESERYAVKERLDEMLTEHLESLGLDVGCYVTVDAINALSELLVKNQNNREWTP